MSETTGPALLEEAGALAWIYQEVGARRPLPALEAHAVAQAVALALREVGPGLLPRTGVAGATGPLPAHSLNAALVTGAFAAVLRLERAVLSDLILAALLADIGQACAGYDPLAPEAPSPRQWEMIRRHPGEGARVLLQAGTPFELPAVVAYEHHLGVDGSGYPERPVTRPPHFASRLVRIADAFAAMTEARARRPAHPPQAALAQLEADAGAAFDRELVDAFSRVVRLPAITLPVE